MAGDAAHIARLMGALHLADRFTAAARLRLAVVGPRRNLPAPDHPHILAVHLPADRFGDVRARAVLGALRISRILGLHDPPLAALFDHGPLNEDRFHVLDAVLADGSLGADFESRLAG